MNKYRAKEIRHYNGVGDKFIIQKRILGIFWVDCEANLGEYYHELKRTITSYSSTDLILNSVHVVKDVLEWLESDKNHMIFIEKNTKEVIFGISLMNDGWFTWNSSNNLAEAKKIEKKINEEKHKNKIKTIITYKYNKNSDELDFKFVKRDGKKFNI